MMDNDNELFENERESMLMITIPHEGIWFSLKFEATAYLNTLNKDTAMTTFESEVLNLRARLLKIYEK